MNAELTWFSVKCIFRHNHLAVDGEYVYEERILVMLAHSFDDAVKRAEEDAKSYAGNDGAIEYCNFASAYHLFCDTVSDGAEVFSLMRESSLEPNAFVSKYHDDGTERAQR